MQKMLELSYTQTLSLNLFKQISLDAGINEGEFNQFYNKYIKSKTFKDNVIELIIKNCGINKG